MKTIHVLPGTPEWHAHRAQHFNASDAPAMLGCSPYTSRAELLRRMHTGLPAEVDASTQRRFDDGHRFEALARPLAESIIGDDLGPVVGVEGKLSASFDGLTLMGDTAWEHKTLSAELRGCLRDEGNGCDLPKQYRVQMEQQLLVSGAERVLFMASKWDGDTLVEERHCWYASDPALRREIVAGWAQFDADLAAYVPPAASTVEKVVAEPVEAFPAPVVQVSGQLALKDNFKVFEERLRDFLEHRLIRQPKSDQDFIDLDAQIKAMKQAREALKSAETQMLAQVQPVDQAKKTKDMLDKLLQQNVSLAEGLLKDEKERRKGEIVSGGQKALQAHIDALHARLGKPYMPQIPADFAGAVRGLKSLASMEDKVATELARAKIAANEVADKIDANLKALREMAGDYKFLFNDAAALVLKAPDDCQAVITARIAEHKAEQDRRAAELAERERARIRQEEADRLQREQREQEAAARAEEQRRQREAEEAQRRALAEKEAATRTQPEERQLPAAASAPADNVVAIQRPTSTATIRLGQISERLGFNLTAEFVGQLGYHPVATEKAAKLYRLSDFDLICEALIAHVRTVQAKQLQAA